MFWINKNRSAILSKLLVLVILGSIGSITSIWAGVYQCIDEQGKIEFRDRPCDNSSNTQVFLPIAYKMTDNDPKIVLKEEKKQKSTLKKLAAKELQAEKKAVQLKLRKEKQQVKEKEKQERKQARLQRVDEKIKIIDNQLGRGAKTKRYHRLLEEKAHCLEMKKRYKNQENKSGEPNR